MKTTLDKLLNGRIAVEQPARGEGYRIAVDTLLLASAVPAQVGERILELGCGVGGVMLALAERLPGVVLIGIEIDTPTALLCESNIRLNKFEDRASVVRGDLATGLPEGFAGGFDHVMMNPPYHEGARHMPSPIASKTVAHMENAGADLTLWIARAHAALREGGMLTLIHRADRQADIEAATAGLFSHLLIKPIAPKVDDAPKRVIVRAAKGKAVKPEIIKLVPHVLYNAQGRYTKETEALLREIGAMIF